MVLTYILKIIWAYGYMHDTFDHSTLKELHATTSLRNSELNCALTRVVSYPSFMSRKQQHETSLRPLLEKFPAQTGLARDRMLLLSSVTLTLTGNENVNPH
jgi:hypothetical protein